MNDKERIALIRKGNELFNCGKIQMATEIFIKTKYHDGLIRVADLYYYDKKMPLIAYKYYKMTNMHSKVDEIFEKMIYALSKWIGEDKIMENEPPQKKNSIPIKVSPKLKILAEEILRDNDERKKKDNSNK